ncbi:unnamed protein product [Sphenostylis stenocarpa]|uniref:Uncharacterized protein n=1 Tax=Sphenostylis stenocarpa TaxID=92480 RepID=A0AA86V8T8_9FABA|nr:unnamed protein product [Sphenostylis stenocarpa]
MAFSLSTSFFCTHSFKSTTLKLKPPTEPHCFARLRVPTTASSRNDNANTDSVETPLLQHSSSKQRHDSSSSLLRRFKYSLILLELVFLFCKICFGFKFEVDITWFKFDELGMEIVLIALPAALALAADPIASLIDTAFVGHIGAVELAAVGVSASVFNLVSKAFNVPLLNITTSFVAEEQALISKEEESKDGNGQYQSKKLLPSVSTSLVLAATLGIAQTVALTLGSGILMNIMGIPAVCHTWPIIDPYIVSYK